jgi:chaperonin GroES
MKLDVKKGDTVLIGKYSGTEIKIDDVEYTILREDEVLAIVEG